MASIDFDSILTFVDVVINNEDKPWPIATYYSQALTAIGTACLLRDDEPLNDFAEEYLHLGQS